MHECMPQACMFVKVDENQPPQNTPLNTRSGHFELTTSVVSLGYFRGHWLWSLTSGVLGPRFVPTVSAVQLPIHEPCFRSRNVHMWLRVVPVWLSSGSDY